MWLSLIPTLIPCIQPVGFHLEIQARFKHTIQQFLLKSQRRIKTNSIIPEG
jgi:hypothetical protein